MTKSKLFSQSYTPPSFCFFNTKLQFSVKSWHSCQASCYTEHISAFSQKPNSPVSRLCYFVSTEITCFSTWVYGFTWNVSFVLCYCTGLLLLAINQIFFACPTGLAFCPSANKVHPVILLVFRGTPSMVTCGVANP